LTKSLATRKIISIFLSTILVIGTINTFFPSMSMTQVHALSANGGMMLNDDENNKSKYSSLKKDNIECNNINLNLNGLNVDAIPESLSTLVQAHAKTENTDIDTNTFDNGAERLGYKDKDFSFVCINNNENEFIPPSPIPPIPPVPVNNLCTVWQDSTPGNSEIFFSVSHDDGETFSIPLNISKNTGASQFPQIACEGNNVYVVWVDNTELDLGNFDIFFARSTNGGQTFSTPDNISENAGNSASPQIAVEGNNVYVVWADNTSTTPLNTFDIFFARSTNGGQTFSTPDNISENTGNSNSPQISSEGNNVYVVWVDNTELANTDIFFSRSTNGGQTFSTPPGNNISQTTGNSFSPQISSEGNNVIVVWNQLVSGTFEVYFARSGNDGATFSTADNLSEEDANESSDPQISSEGNNVYVVWQDFNFDFSASEIFFALSTDGGLTFSAPPGNNISENTGLSVSPQISSEGNNVYVVWLDNTGLDPGNNGVFFARSINGGLTFSTPPDILSESTFPNGLQISSEGNNVYVIWSAPAPSAPDIFFSFSHDNGETFSSQPNNLSKNTGVSEVPQISSTTS
jgi:hypothetical protein